MTKTLFSLALAGAVATGASPVLSSLSPQTRVASSARLSGSSIVSTALSYVGSSYAYLGDTPATGFSCTGFVHWVFSQYGYYTPEDVSTLYYSYPHVYTSNLQPGDVLIFANTFHAGLSHAAIYIGGGQMVGADNFSVGVHVDNLFDAYWGPRFVGGIRIAPAYVAPVVQAPAFTATPVPPVATPVPPTVTPVPPTVTPVPPVATPVPPVATPVPPVVRKAPNSGVRPHVLIVNNAKAPLLIEQQSRGVVRDQLQRHRIAVRLRSERARQRSVRQESLAISREAAVTARTTTVWSTARAMRQGRTTTTRSFALAAVWPSPRFSALL